mmetsp:Transcript_29003/g.39844  ORF Transcript_29003/g.39844 Transcript_29003/m.39844 type:complete len:110 (-) Transcript_29003:2832-3161(-)
MNHFFINPIVLSIITVTYHHYIYYRYLPGHHRRLRFTLLSTGASLSNTIHSRRSSGSGRVATYHSELDSEWPSPPASRNTESFKAAMPFQAPCQSPIDAMHAYTNTLHP